MYRRALCDVWKFFQHGTKQGLSAHADYSDNLRLFIFAHLDYWFFRFQSACSVYFLMQSLDWVQYVPYFYLLLIRHMSTSEFFLIQCTLRTFSVNLYSNCFLVHQDPWWLCLVFSLFPHWKCRSLLQTCAVTYAPLPLADSDHFIFR